AQARRQRPDETRNLASWNRKIGIPQAAAPTTTRRLRRISSATYGSLASRINPPHGKQSSTSAAGAPRIRGRCPRGSRPGRKNDQFVTSVVIRLGTSPTGITALTVLLSVSMAVTDLMAAFEM